MSQTKAIIDGVTRCAVKTGENIGRQLAEHEKQARADYAAGRFGGNQKNYRLRLPWAHHRNDQAPPRSTSFPTGGNMHKRAQSVRPAFSEATTRKDAHVTPILLSNAKALHLFACSLRRPLTTTAS